MSAALALRSPRSPPPQGLHSPQVHAYDVVCEVATHGLVESAYAVGDFAGEVTLLVESQEDGVLTQASHAMHSGVQ